MENAAAQQPLREGDLNWRLSAHPITLLFFLGLRIGSLLMYLLGLIFIKNYVLVFILTMLLLSADFYNIKNIAGRRLVGLRWWNEVDTQTGNSTMVFESLDPSSGRIVNGTDRRFFWLALYVQPVLWFVLGIVALTKFEFIWIVDVVIALILTITNTVAFSRCDKFSQASNLASSAMYSGGIARSMASGLVGRFFNR